MNNFLIKINELFGNSPIKNGDFGFWDCFNIDTLLMAVRPKTKNKDKILKTTPFLILKHSQGNKYKNSFVWNLFGKVKVNLNFLILYCLDILITRDIKTP